MKSIYRLAAVIACAASALALAGNALATQKLEVSQAANSLTVRVSKTDADPQPAKITIYIPTGYTLNTSQPAGTVIGRTEGEVTANQLGGIPVPLSGDVVVDDPAKHVADACAPGTHQAVWDLQLSVVGQTIHVPVYIDATTGAETALGVAKGQLCLSRGDTPTGTPLHFATFTVNNVFTPPTASARWVSLWTPYAAGGVVNPAGTIEARSIVGPGTVTLSARVTSKKKKQVTVSGSVTQSGLPVSGQVSILINGRAKASATAKANGRYSKKVKGTGKRATFQARVTVEARDITSTGCVSPTQAGVQCVSATAGGFTATSPKRTVRF
jgi:hypothetical protein